MTRQAVPSPPPLWYLQAQARTRSRLVHDPDAVIWQARCPHGAQGDWIARLVDQSAHITVHCDCEEAA